MALVGVTAPVRLTTLGVRLSFSLSSLARGHAQIERPPPPFCVVEDDCLLTMSFASPRDCLEVLHNLALQFLSAKLQMLAETSLSNNCRNTCQQQGRAAEYHVPYALAPVMHSALLLPSRTAGAAPTAVPV